MPHKDLNKEKERSHKRHPNRECICPMCQTLHVSYGQTKRKSTICETCYPVFRRADLMLGSIAHRCRKFNIPFDLDTKWLFDKLNEPCPKTGLKFNFDFSSPTMKDRPFDGPSVDKIDPDGGYLKENCQVVIWWYNCMKQRFTEEKVFELCQLVINKHGPISV